MEEGDPVRKCSVEDLVLVVIANTRHYVLNPNVASTRSGMRISFINLGDEGSVSEKRLIINRCNTGPNCWFKEFEPISDLNAIKVLQIVITQADGSNLDNGTFKAWIITKY